MAEAVGGGRGFGYAETGAGCEWGEVKKEKVSGRTGGGE